LIESIHFYNCEGIAGESRGKTVLVKANELTLREQGLSYREHDRSELTIDCRGGFLIQAFFNPFFILPHVSTEKGSTIFLKMMQVGWGGGIYKDPGFDSPQFLFPYFYPATALRKGGDLRKEEGSELKWLKGSPAILYLEELHLLEDDYLESLKELMTKKDFLLFVKAQADADEVFKSLDLYKKTPIGRLLEHDLLTEKTVIIGGDWLTGSDVEAIASNYSWIVHLPAEMPELGRGSSFPILKFLSRDYGKVLIGTGTRLFDPPLFLATFSRLLYRFTSWSTSIDSSNILKMLWSGWKLVDEKLSCIDEGCRPMLYLYRKDCFMEGDVIEELAGAGFCFTPLMLCSSDKGCFSFQKELNKLHNNILSASNDEAFKG